MKKKLFTGNSKDDFGAFSKDFMGWNEKQWVEKGLFYATFAVLNTLRMVNT